MNLAIEHPLVFLGLCGICVLSAWRIYKASQVLDQILADVVPIRPEVGDE